MADSLARIAKEWFKQYLPTLPSCLTAELSTDLQAGGQANIWRWIRFRLALAKSLQAETGPLLLHWHFGFASKHFQQQLLEASQALLQIEAAQFSLSHWPRLDEWLNASEAVATRLRLFNLAHWRDASLSTHWQVSDCLQGRVVMADSEEQSAFSLPVAHPALYEDADALAPNAKAVATRLRAYYLPAAGADETALTSATVSDRPLPVAAWVGSGYGPDVSEAGLRAAQSASSSPLLWRVGPVGTGKQALLKRSSVLFFWGRVPGAGSFERSACPKAQLVVAVTSRPRALRWGEVPAHWQTVQVGPALAEWLGMPPSRSLAYQAEDFYPANESESEQRLRTLIQRYTILQNQVNQRLAEAGETELLAALPWNLLHWIRDADSAQAVFAHKARELARAGQEQTALTALLRDITGLLAELRPVWRRLEALPKDEQAYVVVPIHLAHPRHLPGWLPLHRDLRTHPQPQWQHLTFISLSELKRTAEQPTWPIYLTTVEPRYCWALRQLPATQPLRGLWYRPLLHNSCCHALCQQHEQESDLLYRQLLPLAALAPQPEAAAEKLAADLRATITALNLPAYTAPARFQRPDAPDRLDQNQLLSWPSLKRRQGLIFPEQQPTELSKPQIEAVGALPDEPNWWEVDEGQLADEEAIILATHSELLHQLTQLEEEAAVAETETAEPAPVRHQVSKPIPGRRAVSRPSRLVWRRDPTQADLFTSCREDELRQDDFYLDESAFRKALTQTVTATTQPLLVHGFPFWKQKLREYIQQNRTREDFLFRKMQRGDFGGIKLQLSENTFLNDYLDLNNSSKSYLPGSYQNRAVVAHVIGGGAQDDMQLLNWEMTSGRSLSSLERERQRQQKRQQLQAVRRALLAWWSGRAEQLEFSTDELFNELQAYLVLQPQVFAAAFNLAAADQRKEVSNYFLSLLLENVRPAPTY